MKIKQITIIITVLLCGSLLTSSCRDDHGLIINGRTNADVKVTNETTGVVWHGESKGIEQSITIGENDDDFSYDIVAHTGDVIRVDYVPYPHFAEKHSVSMTTYFAGVSTKAVTHAPYETRFTIRPDVPKGIHDLIVTGVSGNANDKCYLNERRSVRVKVE